MILLYFCFLNPVHTQSGYNDVGAASRIRSGCYQLTPNQYAQSGAVWYTNRINLTQPFELHLNIYLGCDDLGADGMAFVLQPHNANLGVAGGGIGYQNIPRSLAVEFDTYQNQSFGDPVYDHIALQANGDVNHGNARNTLRAPRHILPAVDNLEDCQWHKLKITWNPTTQRLKVYVDCILRLNYSGNIIQNIFSGNPNVYWGMTAATGAAKNEHKFCMDYISFTQEQVNRNICLGNSITLNAGQGVSYSWSPPNGLSNTNGRSTRANPIRNTTYTVTVTDECGAQRVQRFSIKVNPKPSLSLIKTPISCYDEDNGEIRSVVTGGTPPYQYDWDPLGRTQPSISGLGPGIYILEVIDKEGCKAEKTETLKEPDSLGINLVSIDSILCFGDSSGSIDVLAFGGTPPYRYQWSNGSTSSFNSNLVAGIYSLEVEDTRGCTETMTLTLDQPQDLVIGTQRIWPSCCGLPTGGFELFTVGGTPPYWYELDGIPSSGPLFENLLGLPYDGPHEVTVTDKNGCQADIGIILEDIPVPIPLFLMEFAEGAESNCVDPKHTCAQILLSKATVTFINKSEGAKNYYWDFGDGSFSTEVNPVHTYMNPGIYEVSLLANNGCDSRCDNSTSCSVLVVDDGSCFFPNAFTPNGDGINDRFEVFCLGAKNPTFEIYNRWGKLAFSTNDLSISWDGTRNGKPVPEGVYTYILKSQFNNCADFRRGGTITLTR